MDQDQTILPPRRFLITAKDEVKILAEGVQWMDGSYTLKIRLGVGEIAQDTANGSNIKGAVRVVETYAEKEARLWWLDRSDKPCNSQCARCGGDHAWDIFHCIDCGASPNILVPKWFSEGTMNRDNGRLKRLKECHEELEWLRSRLPVPESVKAEHLATKHKDSDDGFEWPEGLWSVSLGNTSTHIKADSKEEARSRGAVVLSWLRLKP